MKEEFVLWLIKQHFKFICIALSLNYCLQLLLFYILLPTVNNVFIALYIFKATSVHSSHLDVNEDLFRCIFVHESCKCEMNYWIAKIDNNKYKIVITLPCHKYCNMRNTECNLCYRVVRVMMFLQSNHCKMVN